ncbi:tetratricopeptide repeat protein [Bacillus canaveralius]|uniref:tetratricopeptide repeat protein n=1 Tax=Bacillus canaveralius TaxID=1403243 RepID=UPI0026BDA42E|nr:tetratricopeptide repeat protein [Bacillus canaveralius]
MRRYTEYTSFQTVVDTENKLSNLFGFKIVPNGVFIDHDGTIRLIKEGFHVTNEEHILAVEKLIDNQEESIQLQDTYHVHRKKLSELEVSLAQTKFKLGLAYAGAGKHDDALKQLDDALELDPDNFLIRKQRWYIRFPEKFSPVIDIEWQQKQLERERAEEQMRSDDVCGPDGCIIPGTQKTD